MSYIQPAMSKAINWLRDNQLSEGQWEGEVGSWFVNFYYGLALALAGERPESERIQQLCDFAESCMAPDGRVGLFPGEPGDDLGTYGAILMLGWARPRSEVLARAREAYARCPIPPSPRLYSLRWILEPQAWPEILADKGPPVALRWLGLKSMPTLMYRLFTARKYYRRPFRQPSALARRLRGRVARAGFWPAPGLVREIAECYPSFLTLGVLAPWLVMEKVRGNNDPEFLRVVPWVRQFLSRYVYEDRSAVYLMHHHLFQLTAGVFGEEEERRRLNETVQEVRCRKGWLQHTSAGINVFDTGLVLQALSAAGVARSEPLVRRAVAFLRTAQEPEGGWSWAYSSRMGQKWRPADMDDTAVSCMALAAMGEPSDMARIRAGVRVLLSKQSPEGFVSTWSDGRNPNISSISVTSRAIHSFLAAGMDRDHPAVQRACRWILSQQERDGAWVDHWLSRYTYGTAYAVSALLDSGYLPPEAPPIKRAVQWLLRLQNPDGGWGETYHGTPTASTADHTGLALHTLCTATRGEGRPLEAIRAGARWLADHQHADGHWDAVYSVSFGNPQAFSDTLMPMVWGLLGLSEAARALGEQREGKTAA